jgi:hypothetical protein
VSSRIYLSSNCENKFRISWRNFSLIAFMCYSMPASLFSAQRISLHPSNFANRWQNVTDIRWINVSPISRTYLCWTYTANFVRHITDKLQKNHILAHA